MHLPIKTDFVPVLASIHEHRASERICDNPVTNVFPATLLLLSTVLLELFCDSSMLCQESFAVQNYLEQSEEEAPGRTGGQLGS